MLLKLVYAFFYLRIPKFNTIIVPLINYIFHYENTFDSSALLPDKT